ncbi:IS701 family transposase [Corynebacterium glutamicum]|uniref:IS701 family transposase n=1 Tax=Corynebacterium glutamicum TaxID=1718 RepID=UPI000B351AB6|nr:IS701 family transposase [Corynebacterium glutamicum]
MNAKTTHTPGDLADFVAEVFASLIRKDQRATSSYDLQGLMLEGRRKSMQPMAQRLGIDHQRLQQFVSTSPWPVEPVRQALATKAIDLITPDAWVVDDTGFVKDGSASPGVTRQYSGTLGKVGNVQIGVSVHAVTDVASCPLNWRLFLPASWDETTTNSEEERALIRQRRAKALIPADVGHRPKWELACEMIDELHDWGVSPPVIVADAGYGDNGLFRTALTTRGLDYVVQVKGSTSVHPGDMVFEVPEYSGFGRPKKPGYRTPPVQAEVLAQSLPTRQYQQVSWRQGSKGTMTSRFAVTRVRPANRNIPRHPDGSLPEMWLLIEWPRHADAPTDYWLSTLPEDTGIEHLVRLGKIRWRIEHDYRELKHGLGLDHFEGRSWLGWHHHTVLVTAAHLFVTQQRLAADPKAGAAG